MRILCFRIPFTIVISLLMTVTFVWGQNITDLRKLTDEEWEEMPTEDRLEALNTSNNRATNQTLFGDFNRYDDLYKQWGYDYYEMYDRYENYSFRGFENYSITNNRRMKWAYTPFGDKVTKMRMASTLLGEIHYDDGQSHTVGPNNGFINDVGGLNSFDGFWVAREETNDWAVSVVTSPTLRAKFTPLTLSFPNLDGTKIDFQSKNYEASFCAQYHGRERIYLYNKLYVSDKAGILDEHADIEGWASAEEVWRSDIGWKLCEYV